MATKKENSVAIPTMSLQAAVNSAVISLKDKYVRAYLIAKFQGILKTEEEWRQVLTEEGVKDA